MARDHNSDVVVTDAGGKKWSPLLSGLASFFGKLSADRAEDVYINDHSKAFTRTALGGMAFAAGQSILHFKFFQREAETEADSEASEAETEAAEEVEGAEAEGEG